MTGAAPIKEYPLRPGPVSIRYSVLYEQHDARQTAGLSLEEYNRLPGTPLWMGTDDPWSKSHVIAWARYNQLIPAVQGDAQNREMERRSRMSGR